MEVPCVRVPREEGEATRQALAEQGALADDWELTADEGWLYIPVSDPDGVASSYEVVRYEVPERDSQTMPADRLDEAPSYERLGDIAIVDEDDPEQAHVVAEAIVESDLPVETVLNRSSKVKGELRVRDWDVLAGSGTETVHREYGCEYRLDLAEVYFSPRLSTERHRVAEQVAPDEQAFDMFAGVGPFVIPFAQRGATVVGVDLNDSAIEYLRENAERNGVGDRVTAIARNVRDVAPEYAGWADRIVMNLPHSADAFLDSAVTIAGDECVLHYYDIQHEDDRFDPGEQAVRAAAESGGYDVAVETRHTVRSYAPHEYNVCLDVRLTR
jgi:tRNA (guanine37-N1)-methyltransferase